MHILYHHGNDLLSRFKSLARFTNQGVENTHQFENLLQNRDTNRGGGPVEHRTCMNEQIMLTSLRRLVMFSHLKQSCKKNHVALIERYENWQLVEKRHSQKVSLTKRLEHRHAFESAADEYMELYFAPITKTIPTPTAEVDPVDSVDDSVPLDLFGSDHANEDCYQEESASRIEITSNTADIDEITQNSQCDE